MGVGIKAVQTAPQKQFLPTNFGSAPAALLSKLEQDWEDCYAKR